jgi:hypothetical protein
MSKPMLGYQIGITYDVTANIGSRAVMTGYALNLPDALKRHVELLAKEEGISLNQFILWSVAVLLEFFHPRYVGSGSEFRQLSLYLKRCHLQKLLETMA